MPTPVEIIFAKREEIAAVSELEAARRQVVDAYVRTYNQIKSHVTEVAGLCAKHGKANLMAGMPQDVQDAINTSIDAIETLWTACSPYPFPEMPDQPVPPEPPVEEPA